MEGGLNLEVINICGPKNNASERINKALKLIAAASPQTQSEVFEQLDRRKVPVPGAQPFKAARGWMNGFLRDEHLARSWLSKMRETAKPT